MPFLSYSARSMSSTNMLVPSGCTIENCISCQGSPPVCQACDDGFVLSESVCGK